MATKKPNEEQRTLVREMVLWLSRRYHRWSREGGSSLNQLISQKFPPATVDELSSLLEDAELDISKAGKYIFFAPPEKDTSILPVASMRFNFQGEVPEVRVQVGLFTEAAGEMVAVGLRFESPEGTGMHNYYHCQFFRSYAVHGGDVALPGRAWLPTKNPTLLLGAKNSVALMLCLIASIYGRTELDSLSYQPFGRQLERYMQFIPWVESEAAGDQHQKDERGRWHRLV